MLRCARIVAPISHAALAKRYPILDSISESDWKFFNTVAAVWTARTMVDFQVDPADRDGLRSVIVEKMSEWDPDGRAALDDLTKFVAPACANGMDPDGLSLCMGIRMLWNMLNRKPADDEFAIAAAMGNLVFSQFVDHWRNSKPQQAA